MYRNGLFEAPPFSQGFCKIGITTVRFQRRQALQNLGHRVVFAQHPSRGLLSTTE